MHGDGEDGVQAVPAGRGPERHREQDHQDGHQAERERAALIARMAEAGRLESLGVLAGGIAHEINTPAQYIGDNLIAPAHALTRELIASGAGKYNMLFFMNGEPMARHAALARQVRDAAAELLNLYARRAARVGHAFRFPEQDYEAFANDFGFEETADQRAAIHAVIQDLISPRPMDRLVCGDVGFGKTEVALRAAFVAISGGKQVAFLAPTTLLAEQHHQTLTDRFSKWPVRIAEMSRFRTAKEINTAIQGLAAGTIDIVVGTHKLLSESVKFKRLGLLIIDEEHRFGVRHKEAIKAMRADIDKWAAVIEKAGLEKTTEIHVVKDQAEVLERAVALVKPGGRIILVNHLYSEVGLAAAIERWTAERTRGLGLRPEFPFARLEAWAMANKDAVLVERRKIPPFGIYTLVCFERTQAPLAA